MKNNYGNAGFFTRMAVFRVLLVLLLAINSGALIKWIVELLTKDRIWNLLFALGQIPELLSLQKTWIGTAALLLLTPLLIKFKLMADHLRTNIRVVILGGLGLGIMLLLSADRLGVALSSGNSILIAGLPSIFLVFYKPRLWIKIRQFSVLSSNNYGLIGIWTLFVFILTCCFLLQFARSGPGGDTFWYEASEVLRLKGFSTYMRSYPASNYDPAYPIISSVFTALAPFANFSEIMNILPFLSGLFVIAILIPHGHKSGQLRNDAIRHSRMSLSGIHDRKKEYIHEFNELDSRFRGNDDFRNSPKSQGITHVFFFLALILQLFFINFRIHDLFFHSFTGKPLLVLCVFSLFLVLDGAVPKNHLHKILLTVLFFGIGFLAQVIKPPLSKAAFIFLLAILVIRTFVPSGFKRHARLEALLPLLMGSLCGKLLWGSVLQKYHPVAFFEVSYHDLANFDLKIVMTKMLPFMVKDYFFQILTFSISILMGLLWYKRFWVPILFSSFMIAIIFVIFATITTINGDYQSGARYVMQGVYSWLLFFFYLKSNLIGRVLSP